MKVSFSLMAFKRWTRRHYGILTLFFGVIGLLIAIATNTYVIFWHQVDRERQNDKIDAQKIRIESLEAENKAIRDRFDVIGYDLREIKGYVKGVTDYKLGKMIERLPDIENKKISEEKK